MGEPFDKGNVVRIRAVLGGEFLMGQMTRGLRSASDHWVSTLAPQDNGYADGLALLDCANRMRAAELLPLAAPQRNSLFKSHFCIGPRLKSSSEVRAATSLSPAVS